MKEDTFPYKEVNDDNPCSYSEVPIASTSNRLPNLSFSFPLATFLEQQGYPIRDFCPDENLLRIIYFSELLISLLEGDSSKLRQYVGSIPSDSNSVLDESITLQETSGRYCNTVLHSARNKVLQRCPDVTTENADSGNLNSFQSNGSIKSKVKLLDSILSPANKKIIVSDDNFASSKHRDNEGMGSQPIAWKNFSETCEKFNFNEADKFRNRSVLNSKSFTKPVDEEFTKEKKVSSIQSPAYSDYENQRLAHRSSGFLSLLRETQTITSKSKSKFRSNEDSRLVLQNAFKHHTRKNNTCSIESEDSSRASRDPAFFFLPQKCSKEELDNSLDEACTLNQFSPQDFKLLSSQSDGVNSEASNKFHFKLSQDRQPKLSILEFNGKSTEDLNSHKTARKGRESKSLGQSGKASDDSFTTKVENIVSSFNVKEESGLISRYGDKHVVFRGSTQELIRILTGAVYAGRFIEGNVRHSYLEAMKQWKAANTLAIHKVLKDAEWSDSDTSISVCHGVDSSLSRKPEMDGFFKKFKTHQIYSPKISKALATLTHLYEDVSLGSLKGDVNAESEASVSRVKELRK